MDKAITTPELFRLLSLSIGREKEATAYMVAKVFGISPGAASSWKKGWSVMDEKNAQKAAEMLNIDNDFIQLSLEAERKNKSGLEKIAMIFERAAIAAQTHGTRAASTFALVALSPSLIGTLREICILCKTFTILNYPKTGHFRPVPAFV